VTETKKYRSPFHGIDLKLLGMLCHVHPWSMAELCRAVDMETSVLSMVLAGKRPLPSRVARKFLALMGMKEDGALDPSHGYLLKERAGREAELQEVHDRLFPEAPAVCHLKISVPDPLYPTRRPTVKTGVVLFQGNFLAVVHAATGGASFAWSETGERVVTWYHEAPEKLLSLTELPTKVDMLRAFAGSKIEIGPTWEEVVRVAKGRFVEPRDAMNWIKSNFPAPETEKNHQK
jgi:hypothetical protein